MKINASIVSPLIYGLYKGWCGSLRYTVEGREVVEALWEKQEPLMFALWHDEIFPLMHIRKNWKIVTVVSQSNDGEVLAQVLEKLGIRTARGSSSRGGVKALLKAAKMMRSGLCGCVTVDGPRGPRHKAKEGTVFLAHRTPAKIVPTRVVMEKRKVFDRAWDKFQLPYPFSRVRVVFGEPYSLPEGEATAEYLARECERLEVKLEGLV